MTYEGDGVANIPAQPEISHYHGDETRMLFVLSALIIIVAKSTGAEFPLSTTGAVIGAVILVIAAGVTNPAQSGIHWFNAVLAITGTLVFGIAAVNHYSEGMSLFDPSFLYVEILALFSLVALYLTTRTIRWMQMHPHS